MSAAIAIAVAEDARAAACDPGADSASLAKTLFWLNKRLPLAYRFRATQFRSRRFPEFESRPDFTVALVPGPQKAVVYKFLGEVSACALADLGAELSALVERMVSFERLKLEVSHADARVARMGLEVVYIDADDDIFELDPKKVESEFATKYPSKETVLQVFRVLNGLEYAYITLMCGVAFIQKPSSRDVAMHDLRQAMLVNSYKRGSNTCTICLSETTEHHVGFTCMMHAYCPDCVSRIFGASGAVCPICRAPKRSG